MASKTKPIAKFFEAHKRQKTSHLVSTTTELCYRKVEIKQSEDVECKSPSENPNIKASASLEDDKSEITSDKPEVRSTKDEDSQNEPEVSTKNEELVSPSKLELAKEQKIRMELNKAAAYATRNMKLCQETVAESRADGKAFPELNNLLVDKSWISTIGSELGKPYIQKLYQFIKSEASRGSPIYPPPAKVFNAFNSCPFEKVKVVILGQDPYHGPGQAMGLCFSVEKGVKFPPSLLNIFKEIQSDIGCTIPSHGNLEKWSYQGVLLLNTVLTVRGSNANSHARKGWEEFTDAAIRAVVKNRSGVIFLLWGNSAQEKIRLIDSTKHHILKAAHPSGLSAHRGFFKCRHFSQTNQILEKQGLLPIDWQI